MSVEHSVARHYGLGDLMQRIEAGLEAQGSDLAALSIEDLAPVDEFHIGGRTATDAFARRLAPAAGARLLDIGCGLGGASRYFATAWSCHVTGIDLTPEYIDVASKARRAHAPRRAGRLPCRQRARAAVRQRRLRRRLHPARRHEHRQ